ncbi:hypothetical protein H0H92_013804, partial [Tricholoma furcatifolium]
VYLRFCCIPVDSVEVKSSFQATKTEHDSADSPRNLVLSPGHSSFLGGDDTTQVQTLFLGAIKRT